MICCPLGRGSIAAPNPTIAPEASTNEIVQKLNLIGDKSAGGLLFMDHDLGKRGAK